MKKVTILFSAVILILIYHSCTEYTENPVLDMDLDVPTDSLSWSAITSKKEDSLSMTRKYIYLTIDDAPLNGSLYIDSIVSATQIKTSLFMVGNGIDGSKRFLQYYNKFCENSYIEIYNHSYSHANNRYAAFYKNPESVLRDFEKNQSDFNISHKIARLPGRNLWLIGERKKNIKQSGATSAEMLAENGYKVFGWDIEWKYNPKDYSPKQSIEDLIKEIEDCCSTNKAFTCNHVVVLMHDQMFGKVNGKNDLGELIKRLKDNDYTFEYLSSYPEISAEYVSAIIDK